MRRSGGAKGALVLAVAALGGAGCPKGNPMDTGGPAAPTVIEHCGTIDGVEVWEADVGHLITCDVVVEGALTVEPGVEVYAERDTALRVQGGWLYAVGSSDEPLLFASAEAFPAAGDWVGLVGQDGVVDLAFATVRHAGAEGALVALDGGTASMSNLILTNSTQRGLYAEGTAFSVLEELEVAYADEPLSIPWAAAAVLSGVYLDQVDGAAVRLLGDTLDVAVGLPDVGVPYLSQGVTVVEGGNLWIDGGSILALSGDVTVAPGGSIVMRGATGNSAVLLGWEGAEFVVSLDRDVTLADFRWASIAGGRVESDAAALSFRYSEIMGAPGDALEITGGVDPTVMGQLSGCSFAGEGYGLVVPLGLVSAVGENDYSGSRFDGVVIRGDPWTADLTIAAWPPGAILVDGQLQLEGSLVSLVGPATLQFADGAALVVDGAALTANQISFTHHAQTPGGWEGLRFTGAEAGGALIDSEVAYGGAWDGANITLERSIVIRDTLVARSAGWGILLAPGVQAQLDSVLYEGNAQGEVGTSP